MHYHESASTQQAPTHCRSQCRSATDGCRQRTLQASRCHPRRKSKPAAQRRQGCWAATAAKGKGRGSRANFSAAITAGSASSAGEGQWAGQTLLCGICQAPSAAERTSASSLPWWKCWVPQASASGGSRAATAAAARSRQGTEVGMGRLQSADTSAAKGSAQKAEQAQA